jgi:hypothetical protein
VDPHRRAVIGDLMKQLIVQFEGAVRLGRHPRGAHDEFALVVRQEWNMDAMPADDPDSKEENE